jgi:hypothetical protein
MVDVDSVFTRLSTLAVIRPDEKLAVTSDGAFSIEEPYVLRGLARRIRRDGMDATLHALRTVVMDVVYICCSRLQTRSWNWPQVCTAVAASLCTLSETYAREGHADASETILRTAAIVGDCAKRFARQLSLRPLPSPPPSPM